MVGTVFDFSVPQGLALMSTGKKIDLYHTPNVASDISPQKNAFSDFITSEIEDKKSQLRLLLASIANQGEYKFSKKTYKTKSPAMLYVVPCMGKTIVSVISSAFGEKPESRSREFPMRDLRQPKPITFETSEPSIHILKTASEILQLLYSQIEKIDNHEQVTASEFGIGASVLLALDLAREKYLPERGSFTMWELMEHGPFVKQVIDKFKEEYQGVEIQPHTSFPRILIKK